MHSIETTTAQVRDLLQDTEVSDRDATITRMGESLHDEGLTVETASPLQLIALLADSPDWAAGTLQDEAQDPAVHHHSERTPL